MGLFRGIYAQAHIAYYAACVDFPRFKRLAIFLGDDRLSLIAVLPGFYYSLKFRGNKKVVGGFTEVSVEHTRTPFLEQENIGNVK